MGDLNPNVDQVQGEDIAKVSTSTNPRNQSERLYFLQPIIASIDSTTDHLQLAIPRSIRIVFTSTCSSECLRIRTTISFRHGGTRWRLATSWASPNDAKLGLRTTRRIDVSRPASIRSRNAHQFIFPGPSSTSAILWCSVWFNATQCSNDAQTTNASRR